MEPSSLKIRREFDAPRSLLRRAFEEAEFLVRWLRPDDGCDLLQVEWEARKDAPFLLHFAVPSGPSIFLSGRFLDVAPDRYRFRLAVTLEGRPDADAGLPITLRLQDAPEGSRLLLEQTLGGDPFTQDELRRAWGESLDRLDALLRDDLEVRGEEKNAAFYHKVTRHPRYRSRFGGLWPDRSDSQALMEGKRELGALSDEDVERFERWREDGYVVLEQVVDPEAIDRFRAEVDGLWTKGHPELLVERVENGSLVRGPLQPELRERPHKLNDVHGYSETARALIATPALQDFLQKLFERPSLAFQSLLFEWGTEQAMHQDSAYVGLDSQMELVGCWIALEDIQPGSGELQYFAGSHRIPEFLWGGRARTRAHGDDDFDPFHIWVHRRSTERDLPLRRFHARKGDLVLWHADLVHGGSKIETPGVTRRSFVVHFCPKNCTPEWWDRIPHSEKLPIAPGSYYCFGRPALV